jgi:hypothetical protein
MASPTLVFVRTTETSAAGRTVTREPPSAPSDAKTAAAFDEHATDDTNPRTAPKMGAPRLAKGALEAFQHAGALCVSGPLVWR